MATDLSGIALHLNYLQIGNYVGIEPRKPGLEQFALEPEGGGQKGLMRYSDFVF